MTLKAVGMGYDRQTGKYRVNVKDTAAKGNIGAAGVIRTFETKSEANEYIKSVNTTGVDVFIQNKNLSDSQPVIHEGDCFVSSLK